MSNPTQLTLRPRMPPPNFVHLLLWTFFTMMYLAAQRSYHHLLAEAGVDDRKLVTVQVWMRPLGRNRMVLENLPAIVIGEHGVKTPLGQIGRRNKEINLSAITPMHFRIEVTRELKE